MDANENNIKHGNIHRDIHIKPYVYHAEDIMMKSTPFHDQLNMSRIGIGCWAFGGGAYWGEQSQKDAEAVVRTAIDLGLNVFDTARMYNEGASEVSLGKALKGIRNEAFIISKVSPAKAYYKTLKEECENSLRSLDTDYIDAYMIHWPVSSMSVRHFTDDPLIIGNPPQNEEAFGALSDLKQEGKIRHIGISNYGVRQMREALAVCPYIAINELPYNIISRAIETEIMPFCIEHGIAVISSMTLQQGILTGAYRTAADVPPHQAHSRHFKHERGKGTSRHGGDGAEEEVFDVVSCLREIADELNISMSQLSIAWVLSNPGISSALVGSRNERELVENIMAMHIDLSRKRRRKWT